VLFATGTYLILQRTLTRIILGVGLIGNGANLLLLVSAGPAGRPPLIGSDDTGGFADPLPQALALTAIVITFGLTAFLLALAYRSWQVTRDDEVEDDVEDRRIAKLRGEFDPDIDELTQSLEDLEDLDEDGAGASRPDRDATDPLVQERPDRGRRSDPDGPFRAPTGPTP
jgi:multicomponent Na+:H+ antiporter subunit C